MRLLASGLVLTLGGCGEEPPAAPAVAPFYAEDGLLVGAPRPAGRMPGVLLVLLDGLRADLLDPQDGGEPPLVSLVQRAGAGLRGEHAFAASSEGLPALASVLTGRLPSEHGLLSDQDGTSLLRPLPTWAEILRRTLGCETRAWVSGPGRGGRGSPLEGFEHVHPLTPLAALPEAVTAWAAARAPERPWFVLLHSREALDPLPEEAGLAAPPPGAAPDDPTSLLRAYLFDADARHKLDAAPWSDERRQRLRAALGPPEAGAPPSAGAVQAARDLLRASRARARALDERLAAALEAFERAGLLDDALVLVAGTHGLACGEHGQLLAGRSLHDPLLHVPLVLLGPRAAARPGRLPGVISLLDLLPTALHVLGLPPLPGARGRPLLDASASEHAPGAPALAQVVRRGAGVGDEALLEGVRGERWAYVLTYDRLHGTVREEAFDLAADPGRARDLAGPDGRVKGLPFEAAFCAAVEQARDRVWGRVEGEQFLAGQGYAAGSGSAAGERPPPACEAPARR